MKVKAKNTDYICGQMKLSLPDTLRLLKNDYTYVRVGNDVYSVSINNVISGEVQQPTYKQFLTILKEKAMYPAAWLKPVA